MAKRVLLIQGHPDPAGGHFGHALADAYAVGAEAAGHEIRRISVATLGLPILQTRESWENEAEAPEAARRCQNDITWAEHLIIFYPLWLGSMPAVLKGFFEQVFRPGFAIDFGKGGLWKKHLKGRSARIVVTMGMPALAYRWWFGAHSLKSLERNILRFCGIGPIRESLVGMVEGSPARREKWLARMRDHGHAGR